MSETHDIWFDKLIQITCLQTEDSLINIQNCLKHMILQLSSHKDSHGDTKRQKKEREREGERLIGLMMCLQSLQLSPKSCATGHAWDLRCIPTQHVKTWAWFLWGTVALGGFGRIFILPLFPKFFSKCTDVSINHIHVRCPSWVLETEWLLNSFGSDVIHRTGQKCHQKPHLGNLEMGAKLD